jgi:uncharacterized membrane protein
MFPTSLLLQQISLIIHFVLEKTKETTFVSQMTKIWRDDIWAALPSFLALKAHNFVSWLTKSWSVSCETSAPVFVFYVTKSPYIVDRKGTCPIIITFTIKTQKIDLGRFLRLERLDLVVDALRVGNRPGQALTGLSLAYDFSSSLSLA